MTDAVIAESALVDGQAPSWLDQLRPASFRGVPFHVDSIEWVAGDNVVLREYPFQDLPTVFRMGRAASELKFSAYVIGEDYHLQRDALMSALTGQGELVHPTAGTMLAYVAGKYSVKEAPTAEGGMARFDVHFVLAEARRYPQAVASTADTAAARAEELRTAAADSFAASWSITDQPGPVAEPAIARMRETLAATMAPLRQAAATVRDWQVRINDQYRQITDTLDELVRAPRLLADGVVELFRLPGDLSAAAARDFRAAFEWAFRLDERLPKRPFESRIVPPVGTGLVMLGLGKATAMPPSSTMGRINRLTGASDLLLESAALAGWAEALARSDVGNYDESMALRVALGDQVTRLLRAASAADAPAAVPASSGYDALMGVYGAVLADLQGRSRDLVRLSTYTPTSWQPVWYVSHRLYGTAEHADELLALNPHIQHPLLVPPGRPLRVVRHG